MQLVVTSFFGRERIYSSSFKQVVPFSLVRSILVGSQPAWFSFEGGLKWKLSMRSCPIEMGKLCKLFDVSPLKPSPLNVGWSSSHHTRNSGTEIEKKRTHDHPRLSNNLPRRMRENVVKIHSQQRNRTQLANQPDWQQGNYHEGFVTHHFNSFRRCRISDMHSHGLNGNRLFEMLNELPAINGVGGMFPVTNAPVTPSRQLSLSMKSWRGRFMVGAARKEKRPPAQRSSHFKRRTNGGPNLPLRRRHLHRDQH